MATVKLATLVIRTIAKPLSNGIKQQAKEHPKFRKLCISLAQHMYSAEVKLRTNILGEPARQHVRPLSETRAVENGANTLAEGFLFGVAALLILGETWRSSRSQSKRRDDVDDQLEALTSQISSLSERMEALAENVNKRVEEDEGRQDEMRRILERVVEIGLRGGWAEFEGTPIQLPRIQHATALAGTVTAPEGSTGSTHPQEAQSSDGSREGTTS